MLGPLGTLIGPWPLVLIFVTQVQQFAILTRLMLSRWHCPNETIYSGPSILSVRIPTGYSPVYIPELETRSLDVSKIQQIEDVLLIKYDYVSIIGDFFPSKMILFCVNRS